jgi:hypothetical protein
LLTDQQHPDGDECQQDDQERPAKFFHHEGNKKGALAPVVAPKAQPT